MFSEVLLTGKFDLINFGTHVWGPEVWGPCSAKYVRTFINPVLTGITVYDDTPLKHTFPIRWRHCRPMYSDRTSSPFHVVHIYEN